MRFDVESFEATVCDKIMHVLSVYPQLSYSMLQVGIGTAVPPTIWRPILQGLIEDGEVEVREEVREAPSGRHQLYTILSLGDQQ